MQCNNCTIAYNQRCCPVFVSIIVLDICRHKVLLNLTSIDLSIANFVVLPRAPASDSRSDFTKFSFSVCHHRITVISSLLYIYRVKFERISS